MLGLASEKSENIVRPDNFFNNWYYSPSPLIDMIIEQTRSPSPSLGRGEIALESISKNRGEGKHTTPPSPNLPKTLT